MRRVAIRTLLYTPGSLAWAVLGVAAAATLILTQVGLYAGFLRACSAFVVRSGGDVWVMARGTQVFDQGEALAAGTRALAAGHPCVTRVRGVIADYAQVRRAGGGLLTVQVLGFEPPPPGGDLVPWSLGRGLHADLEAPDRVAIESLDVRKIGLSGDPLGARLEIGSSTVTVAALTRGIRPFTLTPYVFARLPLARRLAAQGDGEATYWVLDLRDPACAPGVIARVDREPGLRAHRAADFVRMTQDFWIHDSGVGAVLAFGALLSLAIGMVIIGQALRSITRSHLRELCTLKAIGATGPELAGFVAWQAMFVAASGGLVAGLLSAAIRRLLEGFGLEVVLSLPVLAAGAGAVALMCALASVGSLRAVFALQPAEVLK